jgi:predicted transcriptional regulator
MGRAPDYTAPSYAGSARDSILKTPSFRGAPFRHSGARLFGANPESITTNGAFGAGVAGTVVMDSGPARKSAHPGMTRRGMTARVSRLLVQPRFFRYHRPMKTRSIEVDDDTATALTQRELDRRWKAFEAQGSVAANDDVVRWLQTWGTPAFRSWRFSASTG